MISELVIVLKWGLFIRLTGFINNKCRITFLPQINMKLLFAK